MITRSDVVRFVALYGFWILLSWRLDPLFYVLGALAAAAVTATFSAVNRTVLTPEHDTIPTRRLAVVALRTAAFLAWLLSRVVVACVVVARAVLDPKLPIDPRSLRFRTELHSPLARTLLAHSITLTPGTVTVEVDGDQLTVHAMFPHAADGLVSGDLQTRIARVFLEPAQRAPEVTWVTGPEVLG